MNYHYYIGKGPESNALVAEVLEKNTTVTAARVALRDEYGADALILGGWDNDRIAGLGFKEKQSIPFLKGERHTKDGYAYYPKQSCKAGKELATKMANPALTFNASSFIVNTLGISREVIGEQARSRTGMAMYYTTAGIFKGVLLIKIPKNTSCATPCTDTMPVVPAWLREVKESEFLAAQGK